MYRKTPQSSVLVLLSILLCCLAYPGCSDSETKVPTGDEDISDVSDIDELEVEVEASDREPDTESDIESRRYCHEGNSGSFATDPSLIAEWQNRCRGIPGWIDPEYEFCLMESPVPCIAKTVVAGTPDYQTDSAIGQAVFCESCGIGGTPSETSFWLGPGYGCLWAGGSDMVLTGWHVNVGGSYDNACHENWTNETLASLFKRIDSESACETITQYEACLSTKHDNEHCMAVYSWPIEWTGDDCSVPSVHERSFEKLEVAEFLACRTVSDSQVIGESGEFYSGPIINTRTNQCYGFSDYLTAIPEGYTVATCELCR